MNETHNTSKNIDESKMSDGGDEADEEEIEAIHKANHIGAYRALIAQMLTMIMMGMAYSTDGLLPFISSYFDDATDTDTASIYNIWYVFYIIGNVAGAAVIQKRFKWWHPRN